jgi:DNA-binding response OmpR family regulator
LLVEDDNYLSERLTQLLEQSGFVSCRACSAEDALRQEDLHRAAALIVDIGLPGMDGLAFIREMRRAGHHQPILVLTARGDWQQKVDGLNAGADDYVVKPVRAEELVARIRALLRRAAGQTGSQIVVGRIEIDTSARSARLDGTLLDLTQLEFRLLQLFAHRPDHVLTHEDILEHLYTEVETPTPNAIEVQIARLRRKIGRETIRTIRGLGYRLAA